MFQYISLVDNAHLENVIGSGITVMGIALQIAITKYTIDIIDDNILDVLWRNINSW